MCDNGAECGTICDGGICDGQGACVSPEMNPCSQQGCNGKVCGEDCLVGDIMGNCDAKGECQFDEVKCGTIFPTEKLTFYALL